MPCQNSRNIQSTPDGRKLASKVIKTYCAYIAGDSLLHESFSLKRHKEEPLSALYSTEWQQINPNDDLFTILSHLSGKK